MRGEKMKKVGREETQTQALGSAEPPLPPAASSGLAPAPAAPPRLALGAFVTCGTYLGLRSHPLGTASSGRAPGLPALGGVVVLPHSQTPQLFSLHRGDPQVDTSISPHAFSPVPRHLPDFPDRDNPTLEQKGPWRSAASPSPHFTDEDGDGQADHTGRQCPAGLSVLRSPDPRSSHFLYLPRPSFSLSPLSLAPSIPSFLPHIPRGGKGVGEPGQESDGR